MTTLDFKKFEDGSDLFGVIRLFRHFGWFKGSYFLNLMESYIEQKTRVGQQPGNGRATFRDLVEKYRDRHFKRLYVFGTNLTQQAVQKFSYETTPDMAVADAVRISMSIPFFFRARYYEQNGSNDAYCDGGVLNNYPIDTFDEQHIEVDRDTGQQMLHRTPNHETLGFHFVDPSQPASPINSLRSFTGGVIDALLDIQDILLKTNPGDERRSVFINDLGVKFTDFELSDQTKRALIEQGKIATVEYLDKPQLLLPPIKRLWARGTPSR
jgi:NTE family protein